MQLLARTMKPEPREWQHSEGRRRCMRISLNRGGTVTVRSGKGTEYVAFVRDFNFNGIFFYCEFVPELHAEVEVAFSVPDSAAYRQFVGRGKVVRVEQQRSGVVGVAARFEQCDLCPETPRA